MTREEIEVDIATFERALREADEQWSIVQEDPGLVAGVVAMRRALDRLRADLAKLEGPAERFVRIRIGLDRQCGTRSGFSAFVVEDLSMVDEYTVAIVTADVPLPRVVEVEGTVEL